jgi:hypothetical protein
MLKNWTLGTRIASGTIIMLVLAVIVGMAGYFGLTRMLAAVSFYKDINSLQSTISSVKGMTDQYLLATFGGDSQEKEHAQKETLSLLSKGMELAESIKGQLTADEDSGKRLENAVKGMANYRQSINEYALSEEEKVRLNLEIMETFRQMVENMKGLIFVEEVDIAGRLLIANFSKYTNSASSDNWKRVEADTVSFGKIFDDWYVKISNSDELREIGDKIKAQFNSVNVLLGSYHAKVNDQVKLWGLMNDHIKSLIDICTELGSMSVEKLRAQAKSSSNFIFGFIIAALLIGALYAIFSTKKIVGTIKTFIKGVFDTAEQVSSGAGQVSSASQILAEGASEQAASLEETSSSLEEMSSMVKQNADHADEAKSMMAEASQVLDKVNTHMNDMAEAIGEINKSSEETGRIIKTIDEIAFQTNLLALNAAVEAARAGEAGAGFAVVADEVRNLALRAAEAADNTANLIETTIRTVKNGNELTKLTQDAFKENLEISGKVASLVEEIAMASREQSEGVEQINKAVSQMERMVQQNSTSAEESASASKEMDAQSDNLKDMVTDLALFIGGISLKNQEHHRKEIPPIEPTSYENQKHLFMDQEIIAKELGTNKSNEVSTE